MADNQQQEQQKRPLFGRPLIPTLQPLPNDPNAALYAALMGIGHEQPHLPGGGWLGGATQGAAKIINDMADRMNIQRAMQLQGGTGAAANPDLGFSLPGGVSEPSSSTAPSGGEGGADMGFTLPSAPPATPSPSSAVASAEVDPSKGFNPTVASDDYVNRVFKVESGGDPNAVTGSNRGLAQFSPDLEAKYGITAENRTDPKVQADAVRKESAEHGPKLVEALSRAPTPGELYLAHQQGVGGGPALLNPANADKPAWQVLRSMYPSDAVAKSAITGNTGKDAPFYGEDPNAITAGDFSKYWVNKFEAGLPKPTNVPVRPPGVVTEVPPNSTPSPAANLSSPADVLAGSKPPAAAPVAASGSSAPAGSPAPMAAPSTSNLETALSSLGYKPEQIAQAKGMMPQDTPGQINAIKQGMQLGILPAQEGERIIAALQKPVAAASVQAAPAPSAARPNPIIAALAPPGGGGAPSLPPQAKAQVNALAGQPPGGAGPQGVPVMPQIAQAAPAQPVQKAQPAATTATPAAPGTTAPASPPAEAQPAEGGWKAPEFPEVKPLSEGAKPVLPNIPPTPGAREALQARLDAAKQKLGQPQFTMQWSPQGLQRVPNPIWQQGQAEMNAVKAEANPKEKEINGDHYYGNDIIGYKATNVPHTPTDVEKEQSKTDIKTYDSVYRGATGAAQIAAAQKQNIHALYDLGKSIGTGAGADAWLMINRAAAQYGIKTEGAASPREAFNMLAARMLSDQFAGLKSLSSESGETASRIFKPMLDLEEAANINKGDSINGTLGKVRLMDRAGDVQMKIGDAADAYKNERGALDPSFLTAMRKYQSGINLFNKGESIEDLGKMKGGGATPASSAAITPPGASSGSGQSQGTARDQLTSAIQKQLPGYKPQEYQPEFRPLPSAGGGSSALEAIGGGGTRAVPPTLPTAGNVLNPKDIPYTSFLGREAPAEARMMRDTVKGTVPTVGNIFRNMPPEMQGPTSQLGPHTQAVVDALAKGTSTAPHDTSWINTLIKREMIAGTARDTIIHMIKSLMGG